MANSSRHSAGSDGACATTPVPVEARIIPAVVVSRLPYRAVSAPASGIASTEPSAMNSSAKPCAPSERSSRSRIAGMRTANEPIRTPLSRNVTATALRAALMRAPH